MNKHPERFLNGETRVPVDTRFERIFDGATALTILIDAHKPTGEAVLRVKLNEGGIVGVKIGLELDPKTVKRT